MNARMDKYVSTEGAKTRTKRNENLYNEVLDMSIDYVNIDVNNAVELTPNHSNKTTRENYQKERELNKILPKNEERQKVLDVAVEPKQNRIYDINEILNLAKQNKLFEDSNKKRLINTEYNILTKLDLKEIDSEDMKKEDLRSLIDDIYEKEEPKRIKKYSKHEEKELLNELFANDDDDMIKQENLREELSKEILDSKNKDNKDEKMLLKEENKEEQQEEKIEQEKEAEEDFIEVKEGKGLVIAIIVVTILIIFAVLFFVYEYFFGI